MCKPYVRKLCEVVYNTCERDATDSTWVPLGKENFDFGGPIRMQQTTLPQS